MPSAASPLLRCTVTGIPYRQTVPGGLVPDRPCPCAVFLLNGIGLDLEGFRDAINSLELPWVQAGYRYRHGYHVAVTVPGFEDAVDRVPGTVLTMAEQGRRLAAFMQVYLAAHPAAEVILYGFSYGSDLAVEVLAHLDPALPLGRAVLAEMNVDAGSCFITRRITEAFAAARGQGVGRHQEAYKGFVSRVVKAGAEGRISSSLMGDMALYFRSIARKDWDQLAVSAAEASADPEARVTRLLDLAGRRPQLGLELVFSDPRDLREMRARMDAWSGPLERVRLVDATAHEHFHHMGRAGLLENLSGRTIR